MFDEQDRQYFYNEFKNNGYEVGSYDDFKKDLNNKEDRDWYYNEAKNMGYDVGTLEDFDKMVLEPAPSTSGGAQQVAASTTTQNVGQNASTETKPQVAQPAAKPAAEKPKEDNRSWFTKWMTGSLPEEEKPETADKEPGLIAKALGMIPTGVQTSNGTYQPSPAISQPVVKGEEKQVKVQASPSSSANAASPESKEAAPVTTPTGVVNNEGMMDAKLANYLENWKQRPDKQGTYFENMVADLLADGTANSNEEAVKMVQSALGRYANRSAMDVTNQVVSSLPDDTVQDVEQSIEAQWYSHGVQDKLKQEADNMGISYDDYVGQFLKPAMVQSLVNKYGPNYRNIAEGIATRLYAHDEHVQDRLMNQDINDALSSVIKKYVDSSVVDEYNKAQEAGSKAFTEGMEGSQFIPANLRLGTALGAQYKANEAKDPAKVLSGLQNMFGKLYRNPKFLNDMSNAAFKVMRRYGMNGTLSSDPKQFKPMINSVLKNELDQLEIKGMMPKGSAEYIMKTGLGNTIVGKITRKAVQTDYQNWLEDIANQQYQPGFWENVASGALTFAGDAWSYWLPGAAGGKLTKSMLAKAEGRLAGDLMAKGMESRMAARAAKLLIGKSKTEALKSGAVHGAVTFGGQSAISKPIDEKYRTGQFDENGKIYNPSGWKIALDTLLEGGKQGALGVIMQGNTIANMIGKGRGLATNILADVGGKVADSGIMTGHQMLERMAQDPNFKPTGKDAAESFLESMANLTAIGLPGMVGKYARFKDAREFNKKYDFTDQDIAELKRFGYDGLRDAFEKVGIDHLVDNSKMAPHSDENRSLDFALKKDYNKYLEQNYMDLMNDLNVSEVLKAKMMAVVEGKYPSSLSPVVNSEVYKGDNGKYYLETYNKNGGVIDRKEYSSHDAARKDEKKLEHEKILNLASVLESELHKEYLDDYLYNLYNQAGQKYFMGEKLNEEEKAAVYLHQNAAAIGDIMQKRQHGYVLTDEEQKQLNAYRHFYNSVEENSKVMRDFVCTFEDSHGVARGTLRKALESNDKKYATLVESYFKELYNSIELKREMKQTENDFNKAENGREQETSEHSDVEAEMSSTDTAAPEPPVSEGSAPYQDRTNSVPSPSDAEFAANPADVANSSAEVSSSENKVATSDAYVMGQNAYKNGDSEALQAINHNDDMAMARLVRAFADSEKMPDIVANAYNEGKDMELFVAQRSGSLTPAQKEAISKYVEAMNAKKGVSDAYLQEDAGYQENLVEQMKPYATEDGNIQMVELDSGKQVYLKKNGESDMVFIVAPDDQGNPVVKTISKSKIVDMGKPIPFDTFINQEVQRHEQQRNSEFLSQFGKDKLTVGEKADLAINLNDTPLKAEIVSINNDGTVSFVLGNSSRVQQVPREDFLKMRNFANTIGINAELDAEDAQRAEKEAIKAEAEKKQRFADGIVGLSEQKPDYSSKETDPKVAAEYLQEQYADNHDQLIKLVNGSRSDIKEQIDNMRKRIVEAEDWLDTNADLEPEQALSREDKLKLAKEQLEDLTTRYDNWNKIRSLIMTEEEKRELKDERTANIKKVGIDKEALTVTDEREVPVLTDEELKKQYPAMDEASDYILSQRKEISKTQEELHRQLEDIDARLNQYLRGEADLTDEEIRDFNTTKADLEARQANLTESAKELKAQADKLKKLYVQENKKERAAILAEMTPAEQRRVKAEQYLKDGNISGLMKLYGDTSVDFTDNHPNTVDEYVATSIGRFTLNYEGREVDGTFLNGLQQELGGSRKDFDKKQILAAEGKGQTFDKFVNELYDNLPDNLRNQGVNTQEIRNSLLALLRGAEKYSDLKNYILKDKIAKAEEEMRPMDLAEEEQRIAYEENENVPLDEDTKSFDVANSLSAKVGQSLSKEEADNLVAEMEEHAEPVRDLELTPDNWLAEFGEDGKVTTPLGEVKMGENQLAKLFMKGREAEFGLIKPTLSDPDVVIEETSHASTGEEERPSSYLFVKTFERDGKKIKFYASVSVKHDGMEVVISNHFMNKKAVDKKMQEGKMLYIKGASTSNSSDNHLAEHQNGVPDLLPTQEVDALNSESKDTNNFGNLQENSENFSERLKNAIAETETEPTEAQKKAGNYKKGHLTFGGYDFTVETPKGVTRSGKDEQGKPWSVTMHDTYGYILGKIGVDGDHIDMFINDAADLDTFDGNVYVVDQINPETGEFDEHKVMYGYPDEAAATKAYLSNYSKGWKGLGKVTSVPKATFDKWLQSSDRKTKPFADYAMIKKDSDALSGGQKDENLPFAQMNMDDLPFHRDVKEVKPSEMTEAQKVAYDAVSTMLKKAGIPVKVVSNEDMEKVAEAQDNLNLAMLLNQPEMRFKIKTPEEKQAAENAYNFAKDLRPNKWAQYAVVDMSNPNKMPEYYQKQELARKERTYLNRLMWGNYKVFNLDKSFEDNVAGLTGSFPSEFDPYKIDEQTSKKNELKKQIKETEEAYKLTGQERKEYQNQLMKEYMDEHGLASENDIPDDVWREFDYKAIEKYQDKLDSLFAKYKDLDRQLKAVAEPGVQYLKGKGVVYGYTDGKEIVLNQEHLNPNTPIHEYQHLWRTAAKEMNPELIEHGDKLIMQTQLFADLKEDPNYKHLSDDEICDEAFARLTGEDGAAILEQMAKDAIKENPLDTAKELTIINRLKNWLKKFWYWTLDTFTKWKPEDIQKMTLEDIRNLVLRDLANGVDPRNVKSRMTKEDAVSLRKQMEDNAEQERILEHTEENWLKEFGKDSRVTTPIGSIKLGENQYKKAGRNDRIKRFGLLKPTLERPDVILEKSAPKEDAERQTKYLFIKSFKKADGNKILNYESITVKQGEEEVAISAHQIEPSKVVKELTESRVLWNRFRGDSNSLGENQGSALTPSANNPSGKDSVLNPHSDAKIRNSFEITKENGGNLSVEDKIKAVSQQFGVDEADVAMYANAVKKGSTAEAARARANIKRHLLQANEDKISSFKELLKYTVPVNNALKENFGDLDAMIEERKKQVEAQRNAMEAARKRAEEEEAKRKKHLEELSLIPDDQLDKQYMDALAKGDDATAREMLDEAARRKGYDDTESAYQGVGAWAAPGNPGYESDKARRDDWESSGSDVNLEDMALGYTPQPDDYFSHPERYSQNTPHGLESVKAINTAIYAIKNGEKDVKVKVYRAVPTSVKEGKLRNGDWVTPSKKYADIHGNNRLEGKYRIIEDEVPATQLWWDGNDANEFGFDDGKAYKYKNAKNNRKLNDLVTYDDEGDVIPPSKRFNSRKQDVRFHRVTEPEELERLNKEKTFRMYSGMQEVDGKLYSPMAAIIDGKRTDATEIGAWMGADERPDLVKGGKFQLVKTDKNPGAGEGPVRAAYNPYMHTSTSMMNDQFTGAYARGNIKVVEWEIPESEKTSGYRAEGAKDAVGLVPWHSGSVNGLLPKDRQRSVMLSRWRKAVRVVPDSEVAESIAEQLEGTGLAIPWNVVTPNQLRELVKLGVPITTVESGQQTPETKEKFMAQMEELKQEFPQAQFVDVKMTKDAFKEWGKKAHVKARLVESFEKEKARIASDAKEKGSYMLAPNGKKSKLDAEQWATVRTTNFKKWFGDWENDPENASKVVDENGEPMVVYHGRSADFNTFEKKEGVRFIMGLEDKVKAEGFFFSPDRALAEEFAGNAARHRGGKANVVPCYLNIRKPMDLTGEDYDRIYEDVTGWDYTVGMDTQDNLWGIMDEEGMADKIKAKGYDGAIFVEEVDDNYEPTKISYCALDANQIKSADKNNGEFSSRNNDIRFRFGEPYDYEKYPLGRVEPNLATKEVKIVHTDANHGFKDYKEAKNWAIGNICRTYTSDETGNKGEVIINKDVVSKYVSKAARDQSDNDDVHYAVLKVLPDVIREGIEAETHPNFNKVGNARKPEYGYDNHLLIHRVYGAVDIDGVVYRVKITMKENMQDRSLPNKPYSYEVTDISTKIEPLEAIDAQVQDHGSHSYDSISGTNLLKKVEMSYDKGKKLLDESEKMGISIENQRKIADSVVNTANKLGGAEATVYSSLDDVPEEYRSEVEQGAKGWYDPETHIVHVYLPNCEDGNDAQRTVFHEKIGHEGMEVLLGGEDEVRKFANFVYNSVAASTRGKILEIANEYDPDWKKHDRMNVGTQEYIARLAEEGPKTAEDFSLWTKIKHYLIKVLKKLGIRVPGLLNDKDLRYYLMKAGKALHVWDEMPQEKQEAMMKQASNAEIRDSLGEGADLPSEGDNKLKKKTERGRIDEATGAFKLAPNGEQSNLSKKQYIEARTKNFKVWFGGDWEKKPKDFKNKLDANGEPLEKYVEGYLNRPKKPTMPKKRKGEDEATFFERKILYSHALEDWPKTEADWKKRIDEFDENTLAALTPPDEEAIREKYQKQYENDMASWRKDHHIEEGEERTLKYPDMRDYKSIQDYGEALRKHEIWKTVPNKDEYDRMAEDEIISKVALMDAVQHPFSEYARLKAMKAEFQHIRHVMQNQKVYDQNTTDAVVQFAKRFMSLGYGDDLGRGSINTLLTIVKNSTGRKSHEIPQQLYQVMDVLMNNQLRNFDRAVMKTMSIKELKENAKGIQVQGKLELRGQTTIKAFRDAISSRIPSDKLDEKISNLIDKMTDDRQNASYYQDELLGLNLAKQYVDYIDSSRNDAIEIEDLKKLEVENYKDRKGIYKGELTKALLQEHVERLNQYDEALFNNKVERMDRYSQLLANLGGMIDESVKGAREFQERDARRAINVKMMASADLGDKSMNQHHKENWKTRLSNSDVARLFCSPLGSFDALMREFGSKQINGEGQLWNHFVRGAMKASNDEFKSVREANNEIDLKVSELFGKVTEDKNGNKKGNMILNDLYALERSNKVKSLDVTIRDIEGEQTYKLQQGNLMYIYMVNKMPDGAMKLREMGILDADVERIKENIDPRFLKLADWIQGEFLPKMRTKYNKRHEELFGAPMPMVENYFPLRVLKNARYMEEDVNNTSDGSNALPSTATGAIIKRKTNKLPLDILNADALSVTIDNIKEMENWYNYAPIRKDANTLLSDTTFRNRVQNMTTIYGSGERLWNNVKDATAVAMGTYRPKGGTDLAVSLKNIAKGITAAKISFRLYTAFKQVLSAPMFLPDVDLGRFVRHSVHPYGSFKWAIENLPNFDKRWSGRKLGDTVLMDDPTDWKLWHTNLMEKAVYYGMTPNALVDAVTCAVGARAVYDTKYKQYIKYGLTEERAKEKALSDAEINFNTSQQSSEGAFVSPMQLDRTLESAIFTPFRNSSMLYERKGINALRNLKHRFEKGHKEASIKFMAGQLMDEGVGYDQATKAAEKMYKKGLMHNIADAIVALWLGPIIWNLGGNLGYLIPYLGDDENKKKKMVIDAVILGLLEGPVDGLAGGQFINTAIANTITSDGISLKGLKNVDFSGMPMLSDFNSMIEKFGYDKVAGAQDLMFMVMQSATGFNPKTLTDAINACIDYGNGDMTNAKEIALFVFRLMNGPAATVDNLYIDELGMKGKDAKKLSYEELAKRYAEYKFGKNTFGLGKLYSDEEKQKKLKAIEKSFDKKVSERLAGMDREDLKNEFSESRSQKEKKLIGKIIADELGTKDSEAVKKAKADASYLRQRNFSDLMDDLFLQQEWESTKTAQDGLDDLKGNGATDEEIKSYKLHHKIELDKRKAIEAARKAMGKEKKNLTSDNDTQVMAKIRAERDKVLIPLRKQKSEK